MANDLVSLAPVLRHAWFVRVAARIEREYPGSWQSLSMAALELQQGGTLLARIPYPSDTTERREVKSLIVDGFSPVLPGSVSCDVKFTTGRPRASRVHPSGLDVHHWGDPHPDQWPALVADLRCRIESLEVSQRRILDAANVVAVSQKLAWFEFPDAQSCKAVGSTPGVAFALQSAMDAWRRGSRAVRYSRESG